MQSDPKLTPHTGGDHRHHHGHDHDHGHGHDHAHGHDHPPKGSQAVTENQRDLISPVLRGVWQRVLWSSLFLGALWLLVFWALHTND